MIAIYARQSVDRADSISIEQQIELCKYETRGEPFKTYIDKGYSGKNTNRPEFTQMMSDIREGFINTVIVYKLDRISRSILDFSNMIEMFSKRKVQFISATEKFDTSSPMGNAMLNICIVFAQLERETIQKRVADAYFSRSHRSFFMGGSIPYGYRTVPTVIDGIHTSMYEPVPEEANVVRMIYEMYSQPQTSYGDIIDRINELGIKKRGKVWVRQRIREIISNPIYVKADLDVYNFFKDHDAELVNPPSDFIGENGCYSYKSREAERKDISKIEGTQIVLAPHKGIIESSVWLRCREKCLGRKQMIPVQKAKHTWLSGKIKCGVCGYAVTAKEFDGGRRRYLRCSNRLNSKTCKGTGTLYTNEVESIVYNEMKEKLAQFRHLSPSENEVPNIEQTQLENELAVIDKEISELLKKVKDSDNALFRYINERINALDVRKDEINERIKELSRKNEIPVDEIDNHLTMWEELSFDDKRRVVDTLIKVIYATSEKITIKWRF
ncbi:recombinase family protein [Ruminococcus flavefaciens]|uniref:recombinase family protein n=1 Tax=Ruminococcus flavefaciens TaxID=1265 RepID=UPI00350E3AF3